MTEPRVCSLYSGSTGNAFFVSDGQTHILIDAGKNCKRLCEALSVCGVSPKEISAIFLTHEHNDHTSALSVFLKKFPMPVHLPKDSMEKLAQDETISPHLVPHEPGHTEIIGTLRLTSFLTPHDSCGSVGYRIESELCPSGFPVGYATDIGYVSGEVRGGLTGCKSVILESNHDTEMLREGPYPADLKKRIASKRGHLSNADCAELASKLYQTGTSSFMLAHISQENNTPDTAYDACFCAIADESIRLYVASPEEVTELPMEGALC